MSEERELLRLQAQEKELRALCRRFGVAAQDDIPIDLTTEIARMLAAGQQASFNAVGYRDTASVLLARLVNELPWPSENPEAPNGRPKLGVDDLQSSKGLLTIGMRLDAWIAFLRGQAQAVFDAKRERDACAYDTPDLPKDPSGALRHLHGVVQKLEKLCCQETERADVTETEAHWLEKNRRDMEVVVLRLLREVWTYRETLNRHWFSRIAYKSRLDELSEIIDHGKDYLSADMSQKFIKWTGKQQSYR